MQGLKLGHIALVLNSYIELDFKARAIAMAYRTILNSYIELDFKARVKIRHIKLV